ncbi:hypothetical protein SAMN05428977_101626 [Nitrosomonas sp. Nm166]|nr:hypothetical protein SAMN05428977_101626 [Nitrosomonas sp. Nm166]
MEESAQNKARAGRSTPSLLPIIISTYIIYYLRFNTNPYRFYRYKENI